MCDFSLLGGDPSDRDSTLNWLWIRKRPVILLLHLACQKVKSAEKVSYSGTISKEDFCKIKREIMNLAEDSGIYDLSAVDAELTDFSQFVRDDHIINSDESMSDDTEEGTTARCPLKRKAPLDANDEEHSMGNFSSDLISKIIKRVRSYESQHVQNPVELEADENDESLTNSKKQLLEKSEFGQHIYLSIMSNGSRQKLFCCDVCSYTTSCQTEFACHMKDKHNIEDGYECCMCDESFRSNVSYEKHCAVHQTMSKVQKKCDRLRGNKTTCSSQVMPPCNEGIEKPLEDNHDDVDNDDVDDIESNTILLPNDNTMNNQAIASAGDLVEGNSDQSEIFVKIELEEKPTSSLYVQCEIAPTGERRKSYQCNICDFKRTLLHRFALHMQEAHGIHDVFECEFCYERFISKDELTVHRSLHNDRTTDLSSYENKINISGGNRKHRRTNIKAKQNYSRCVVKADYGRYIYIDDDNSRRKLYCCDICDFERSNINLFAKHMLKKHDIRDAFECDMCEEKFENYTMFDEHRKFHTNPVEESEDIRKCEFSPHIFLRGTSRNNWMHRIYRCDANGCSFVTHQISAFAGHLLDDHGIIDGFECFKCPYKTPSHECYKLHIYEHQSPYWSIDAASSGQIGKEDSSTQPLQSCQNRDYVHLYRHIDGTKIPVYICDVCHFSNINVETFFSHMTAAHKVVDVLECSYCEYKVNNVEDFMHHKEAYHNNVNPTSKVKRPFSSEHQCEFCGFSTVSESRLKQHMSRHNDEYSFLCHKCDYRARQQSLLDKHMASKHGEGTSTKFVCDEPGCKFTSQFKCSLVKHQLRHKENPNHSRTCETCGFVAKCSSEFARHIKFHLEMKEFECPFCSFTDYDQQCVRKHLIKHTNESEFICQYCDKCFLSSSGLKCHLLSHEGIKPWQCSVCSSRYVDKEKVKKHIKLKHDGMGDISPVVYDLKAEVKRKVSRFSSEVLRVSYNFRQLDDGTIELFISGKSKVGDKEVLALNCEQCSYITRSGNAFILHKIMEHTDCLKNLPPIVDRARRAKNE